MVTAHPARGGSLADHGPDAQRSETSLRHAPTVCWARRSLPSISETERERLAAGDVWWDGDLLSGNPDCEKHPVLAAIVVDSFTREEILEFAPVRRRREPTRPPALKSV
jgi:hypothetical protein